MKIFKLVEIDMAAERARVNKEGVFNARQKADLTKLYDLFEAGEWKKCLRLVRSKKAFPYNERGEYPEIEHIGCAVADVLQDLGHANFFTQKQLLDEAKVFLSKP